MNQTQFQAGYILDGINETLKNIDKLKEIKELFKLYNSLNFQY